MNLLNPKIVVAKLKYDVLTFKSGKNKMGAKKIPKYNEQCSPAATELYLVLRY